MKTRFFLPLLFSLTISCAVTEDNFPVGKRVLGNLQEVTVKKSQMLCMLDYSMTVNKMKGNNNDSIYFEITFSYYSKDSIIIEITPVNYRPHISMRSYVLSKFFFYHNDYLVLVRFRASSDAARNIHPEDFFMLTGRFESISIFEKEQTGDEAKYILNSYKYIDGFFYEL